MTVVGLFLGSAQFLRNQTVEAAKPYLQKKLQWCEEAVDTASVIATAETAVREKKTPRFWQLYWGLMVLVENQKVTDAMQGFKDVLLLEEAPSPPESSSMLKSAALNLAKACREEMADSWSPIWRR